MKLIKYDLKSSLKFISIFYILGIIFGIFTRIFFNIENSLMFNIIGQITNGATISMIMSIIINNLMRSWVRFKNTLYDDESYLIHTLPISKKELYLSKIITSFIFMLISFILIIFILFITYYSKENLDILKNILLPFSNMLDISIIKILIILIFILFLEIFSCLLCGYLGIIIGHKFNDKKILYSIIFGFISYSVTQIIVLIILFMFAIFNSDVMEIFATTRISDLSILKTVSYISIISYSFVIILNLLVSIKIFNKGVNVD